MTTTLANLKSLRDKHVVVAGAGISGVAVCRFLNTLGSRITLVDDAPMEVIQKQIQSLGGIPQTISLQQNIKPPTTLQADVIILSPGISKKHPAIQAALDNSVLVVNEIDLSAAYLPRCRFVGITGTNGKSTTTTILGTIAKTFDNNAFVGGNLGTPLCDTLVKGNLPSIAILELSSYQLELISLLRLEAAVVTNLTPDHLDRYQHVENYYQAKSKIFDLLTPNGKAILNGRDSNSKEFLLHKTSHLEHFDFNVAPSQMGITITNNELLIHTPCLNTNITLDPERFLGQHNYENAAAAVAGALALNIPLPIIEAGLNAYQGIPHRLESLGYLHGVRWVNDSKATNVDSAIIAIENFSQGIHLIVGGLGKKSSYAPLVEKCRGRVKAIYTIGQDAPILLEAFQGFSCFDAKTLENAVKLAQEKAKAGDTILLAPACASWDQFENFAQRGDLFRTLFEKAKCV